MGNQAKARLLCLRSCYNQVYLNELYKQMGSAEYTEYLGLNNALFKRNQFRRIYIYGLLLTYPAYVLYLFFKSLIYRIRNKARQLMPNSYYLMTSIALPRVVKNSNIVDTNGIWIELPWKNNVDVINKVDVFEIITYEELFKSYLNSIRVFYYTYFKYGIKKCFLQLHSFEWFIYYFATLHIPFNSNIIFCSHLDKWTVLLDHIKCKRRILVQHGTEIIKHNPCQIEAPYYKYYEKYSIWHLNPPYKFQNVNKVYAFSRKELEALKISILKKDPQDVSIVGYGTVLEKNESSIPIILIIGFYREYIEQETIIIKASQNLGYKVILKNHPTVNPVCYSRLKEFLVFDVINGDVFPDAEIVFSYDSTLAFQYEDLGKKVYYYSDIEMSIEYVRNLIRMHE